MRLAIISPFAPELSGVGQYGVRMAQGLAQTKRFSAVDVLANTGGSSPTFEERDGLTIKRIWQRDRLNTLPALLRELTRLKPDVVWFNLGLSIYGKSPVVNFCGHLAPMLAKATGLPTVVTLHELFEMADLNAIGAANHPLMNWGGRLATRLILRADYVCLTLRSYASVLAHNYGVEHLIHIPHGTFDAPHFGPLSKAKRLLYFGGHAPYKGLEDLLEMYRSLKAEDPTLDLVVAGSDHPRFPGYFAGMRAAYAKLPDVTWMENVPEAALPALFESARVVALPYTATTGASSASIRAAAHGRPVVAYALRDLRALATDENLEITFAPVGDQGAFQQHLRALLNDPARCERIGRANVLAMQAHTLEITCQHYANLFYAAAQRQVVEPDRTGRYKFSSIG